MRCCRCADVFYWSFRNEFWLTGFIELNNDSTSRQATLSPLLNLSTRHESSLTTPVVEISLIVLRASAGHSEPLKTDLPADSKELRYIRGTLSVDDATGNKSDRRRLEALLLCPSKMGDKL